MTADAWLAIAHHIAIFGVFAVLVAEWTIVRPGIDAADVRRLGRVDAAYGALAGPVRRSADLPRAQRRACPTPGEPCSPEPIK